jgi:glycosyltransferase involved in cell wall biosynthesis
MIGEKQRKTFSVVFVSWAPFCSRSDSIATHLNGSSYMIYVSALGSNYCTVGIKYVVQAVMTWKLLRRTRADVVFVMSPPLIAVLAVWLYTRFSGGTYLIDAHTAAFVDARWQKLSWLQRFVSRRSEATIVTDHHWARLVESWGARTVIVEEVPVVFPEPRYPELTGKWKIVLVATFTKDEPIAEFLEAARSMPTINFFVTGDPQPLDRNLRSSTPSNVKYMGFLPEREYVGVLLRADAVMCLTTLDHTMQRGAYEAMYLERPIITSNTELLRSVFSKGTVHVDSHAEDICRGVKKMLQDLQRYQQEVVCLRNERLKKWLDVQAELEKLISL